MLRNENLGTGILAAIGFLILLLLPFNQLFGSLDSFKAGQLGDTLKNSVIILYGWILIKKWGYIKASGVFKFLPRLAYLFIIPTYFLFLGPLQYSLFDYTFYDIQSSDVLILLIANLTVGLSEEIIFRGFMVSHLIKGRDTSKSLIYPLSLGAFLFGGLHFLNLLANDANTYLVVAQVTYATMFGVSFGVLLLRTNSLFPIGILHGLINFTSNWHDLPGATEPAIIEQYRLQEALLSVLVVLPFFLFSLVQLKKVKQEDLN
ncbi:MAG: CPBP family intramembrane glutamic endopeptidase [Bacteroidota bacterium]